MKFIAAAVLALMPTTSLAMAECESVFLSDDRSVAVTIGVNGYNLNGKIYGTRGCGTGLMCATDPETDEFIPHFLSVQAPDGYRYETPVMNYRHPERGDILLKPYCITPQPAE